MLGVHPVLTRYRIVFERIGRCHTVAPLEVEAEHGDALAHHIHAYAGRFLGSQDYVVTVNVDHGWIDGGRFGRFTVEAVEPATAAGLPRCPRCDGDMTTQHTFKGSCTAGTPNRERSST